MEATAAVDMAGVSDEAFDTMLNEIDENEQKEDEFEDEDAENEEDELEIEYADDEDGDIKTPSLSNEEITKIDTLYLMDDLAANEKKYNLNRQKSTDNDNVNWTEIMDALRAKNTNFIKTKLSSKQVGVNAQHPSTGKTLLIYAVIIGDFDLVKVILNSGANVSVKDDHGLDALDYAIKFGQYKVTELLYYRQLSGKTGNDLKQIKTEIFRKKKEAEYIKKTSPDFAKYITEFMIAAINERASFDASLLFYAWYFNEDSMTSALYRAMMQTYEEILSDTKDKKGWKWLKENFLNSLIWFLRHPYFVLFNAERIQQYKVIFDDKADGEELEVKYVKTENVPKMIDYMECFKITLLLNKKGYVDKMQIDKYKKWADPTNCGKVSFNMFLETLKQRYAPCPYLEEENEENGDEKAIENEEEMMENTLKQTLFYELLRRVRTESKKQSDLLLKDEINKIKNEQANDWNDLVKYEVVSKQSSNARQDAYIKAQFEEKDLSEDKYPPSTHFSAKKFYDTSIYLNDLMFTANILNDEFQRDVMKITKQIAKEMNENVSFRMGPVKTLTRSQTKVENDYINEQWPKSAKILDINRCALQFKEPRILLKFLAIFEAKVQSQSAGSIKEVIRCKNGWSVYNEELPSYTDIKLNVLIHSKDGKSLIAEIQFLLDVMSAYKKVAHKLYGIERKFELVFNYKQMADKMEKFDEINGTATNIANRFIVRDDIIGFEAFESCLPSNFGVLLSENSESFGELWKNETFKFLKFILLSKRMNDQNKCKTLAQLFNVRIPSNFDEILSNLKQQGTKYQNLCNLFDSVLHIWRNPPFVAKRFFCISYKVQSTHSSLYKFVSRSVAHLSTFGLSQHGALGLGSTHRQSFPEFAGSYAQIAASNHCLAVDGNKNVFVWGDNYGKKLGIGKTKSRSHHSQTYLRYFKDKAKQIAVGVNHSMILTLSGIVYTFGLGRKGQLGHDSFKSYVVPKVVESVSMIHIFYIAAGPYFSMLVSRDGKVYAFGDNEHGQTGLSKSVKKTANPTKLFMPSNTLIRSVECGRFHSMFLSSKGGVLSCGERSYCGHKTGGKGSRFEAKQIGFFDKMVVISIAAGSVQSFCVNEKKKVYSFGSNYHGTLGHSNKIYRQQLPKCIDYFSANGIEIASVYANYKLSAAISVGSDALYIWGIPHLSQMGGMQKIKYEPHKLPLLNLANAKILNVSFGEKFMGIISESKDESTENEIFLKGGEEKSIENDMNNVKNTKVQNVYVQNEKLFGDNDWIPIGLKHKYVYFPYFGQKFLDNLVLNEEKGVIELINWSEIDSIYHSDILNAQFFQCTDGTKKKIIKSMTQKQTFMLKSKKLIFSKIEEIAFKFVKKNGDFNVYVRPKRAKSIYLLFVFKGGKKPRISFD